MAKSFSILAMQAAGADSVTIEGIARAELLILQISRSPSKKQVGRFETRLGRNG